VITSSSPRSTLATSPAIVMPGCGRRMSESVALRQAGELEQAALRCFEPGSGNGVPRIRRVT
jgi:hypothetical protein